MVVADTGAVYALIDRDDVWHKRVTEWWQSNRGPIVLPVTVLPEVSWLLRTRIGAHAERAFAAALAEGEFVVEPLETAADLTRIAELLEEFADLPAGFVDASVVAVAERLGTRTVLTTDRRHFTVLRTRQGKALRLVP
jgi:predicted nucleic acid-binding protein